MTDKGTCPKHGEFLLRKGCPQCIADRQAVEGNTEASIAEAIEKVNLMFDEFDGPDPTAWRTGEEEHRTEPATETAVALRPGEDIEAHSYYDEALKLLEYAEKRVIKTLEDNKSANDDLSGISKIRKVMENKRKSLLDPLKLQSDAIRDTYNYLMAPVLEADKITRQKMGDFDKEQKRIRREQEEINRLRIEAAEKEAALSGTGEITESVNLVEVAAEAPKHVSTFIGTSWTADCWKYEIIDVNLIPREYMMPDTSMLNATAKKHHDKKLVAGVRFYNEPIIANRAR